MGAGRRRKRRPSRLHEADAGTISDLACASSAWSIRAGPAGRSGNRDHRRLQAGAGAGGAGRATTLPGCLPTPAACGSPPTPTVPLRADSVSRLPLRHVLARRAGRHVEQPQGQPARDPDVLGGRRLRRPGRAISYVGRPRARSRAMRTSRRSAVRAAAARLRRVRRGPGSRLARLMMGGDAGVRLARLHRARRYATIVVRARARSIAAVSAAAVLLVRRPGIARRSVHRPRAQRRRRTAPAGVAARRRVHPLLRDPAQPAGRHARSHGPRSRRGRRRLRRCAPSTARRSGGSSRMFWWRWGRTHAARARLTPGRDARGTMKAWRRPVALASWRRTLRSCAGRRYPRTFRPELQLGRRASQIPRIDLPFGTLRWQASSGDRALRAVVAGVVASTTTTWSCPAGPRRSFRRRSLRPSSAPSIG